MINGLKGIIFDLDGVICSTDLYHFQAWKEMAAGLGITVDESVNDRLKGVSRLDSLNIVLSYGEKEYTDTEKEVLMEQKNNRYRELLNNMTPEDLTDEVRNTLQKLRDGGLKLAIGSSSKNAKFILERISLSDFFDAISDGTNIQRSKPDPQVFLMAAEMLQLNPQDCLVVEDAQAGIDAAVAGGFHCAGIGSAMVYEKTEYPVKSFHDLEKICIFA